MTRFLRAFCFALLFGVPVAVGTLAISNMSCSVEIGLKGQRQPVFKVATAR